MKSSIFRGISSAFVWTPEVANEFVRLFLPVVFTFSPNGTPPAETWTPFIRPSLLKASRERFQKNQGKIQSEGLNPTLFVRQVNYQPETETARVLVKIVGVDQAARAIWG